MTTKIETFIKQQLKTGLPDIRPGDTVRIFQKIPARNATHGVAGGKEGDKEKIQAFEGLVIARKHGKEIGATITVRKIISGIGVEKIFPIHSSTIEKIEILKREKVRRAKLYYLREAKGRKAKLKKRRFVELAVDETPSHLHSSLPSEARVGDEASSHLHPSFPSETRAAREEPAEEKIEETE